MKVKNVIAALSALAQDSRLSVFRLLLEEEEGLAAGIIAEKLDVPITTMSFHLSQLKNAGLINARKEGRSIIYEANRKRVKKLSAYIRGKDLTADSKFNL